MRGTVNIPKIQLGPDRKEYSDFVYSELWKSYSNLRRLKRKVLLQELLNDLNQRAQAQGTKPKLRTGGLSKVIDVIRSLRHLGITYRKLDHTLIRRRSRPERHLRILETGRKIVVNRQVLKHKIFPALAPKPMLAEVGPQFLQQPGWITERKFDGSRAIAIKRGPHVKLYSRSGKEYTANFPQIVEEIKQLRNPSLVLDGEIVYLDSKGNDQFRPVQMRFGIKDPAQRKKYIEQYPVTYFIFDLLEYDQHGKTVERMPLSVRKQLLNKIFRAHKFQWVKLTDYARDQKMRVKLLEEQKRLGREGVIHKDYQSPYIEDYRSPHWRKHKFVQTDDVIVIGYEPGEGSRQGRIGALYTAMYKRDGRLQYTGKIGTGFTSQDLDTLKSVLDSLPKQDYTTLVSQKLSGPEIQAAKWGAAQTVIEISHFELSPQKRFRHGAFLRIREDKKPKECKL